MSPFKEFYQSEVIPALQNHFNYENVMQIPKLDKITLNIGAVSYTHLTLPTILRV